MAVAVTGGTGFIGRRIVRSLAESGHDVAVLARGSTAPPESPDPERVVRHESDLTSVDHLSEVFAGHDAVIHLAGINYERGDQTYEKVHRQGTATVVSAAERAGVARIVLTSYLRARPASGSGYLDSKWEAEERVRDGAIESCILKPAGVFGRRDQFLTGLARWIRTIPIVPTVGLAERELRPVAVEDVVRVATAALSDDRLQGATVPLMGPTRVTVSELARRIGTVIGRHPLVVPAPIAAHQVGAIVCERTVDPPLVTRAGVRMLAEGMTEPAPTEACDRLPSDLRPDSPLDRAAIERAVGDVDRYGLRDLRLP